MKLFAERRRTFPDPRSASEDGIVDFSDDVRVERLLEAYSYGIFPWPHEDLPTLWFCPAERGVLDFDELHVPRSLAKFMGKTDFVCTFDRDFDRVIEACARVPRAGQDGTWITPLLLRAYKEFHRAGYAHSVEVWREDELVGGLYGVWVGGVFGGESMFHYADNASKFALLKLVEILSAQGVRWMDTQMVTPVLEQMGGKYIPRAEFLARVDAAKPGAKPLELG